MSILTVIVATVMYATAIPSYHPPGMDRDIYDVQVNGVEIESVSELICSIATRRNNGTGECGEWCSQDRSEISEHLQDRSGWAPSHEWCNEAAESIVFWSSALDVPVEDVLVLAQREGRFQPYAMGRDSECGMFQQHAHYARPEEMREHFGCDPDGRGRSACPIESRVGICEWLQDDVSNQVYSAVVRIRSYMDRYSGDNWICHWNAGTVCDSGSHVYAGEHRNQRGALLQQLRELRLRSTDD